MATSSTLASLPAGTRVRIKGQGFFQNYVGKISQNQEAPNKPGIWVDLKVVEAGQVRRLWFSTSEIERVLDES